MSDIKAVLLGTIVGGMITMGANWVQGEITLKKELSAERRQKMATLMETVAKLSHCSVDNVQSDMSGSAREPECALIPLVTKVISISNLYFPEMKEEVGDYIDWVHAVRDKADACQDAKQNTATGKVKYIDCLKAIPISSTGPGNNELAGLFFKSEAVFKTIR